MAQQIKHLKTSLETTDDYEDNIQHAAIYAKDSLDRFGDDLCQLLLSYLSLKDRFVFQCVSKQFQRTVFVSVVDIDINDELIKREDNSKTPIFTIMKIMAKKCPNIQFIDFREVGDNDRYIIELFPTIQHKFPKLREIYCNLREMSDRWVRQLAPLITRVDNILQLKERSLIHCHRLSHLRVYSVIDVFDTTSGQLLANNLHECCLIYSVQSEHMSRFVAGNQSLKSVIIRSLSNDHFAEMCGQLSRLPHLRELKLSLVQYDNSLAAALRTIGVNCKQLQRLALESYFEIKESDLKTLDQLTVCRRLTHLSIRLTKMDTNLWSNCNKQWPRLHFLHIDVINAIDIQCLSHISRLPALQMIVIHCHKDIDLSDNDFNDLLSRSPKLKNIKITVNKISKFYSK